MKQSAYDRFRDNRVADDSDIDRDFMCRADGCPNKWSVRIEGRQPLCSAHAWSDPHDWPAITQEWKDELDDRARRAAMPAPKATPLTLAQKTEIVERMKAALAAKARRAYPVVQANEETISQDEILRCEDAKRELQRRVDERIGGGL